MRSSPNRAAGVALAALALLGACSLQKEIGEDPSKFQWRSGRIEQAGNAQVQGTEDRDSRIVMGVLAGPVGIAMALATEKDLGKAGVWRYTVRDGDTPVYLQSFSIFQVGDCVRYAMGGNPADTPMERLPSEQCAPAR